MTTATATTKTELFLLPEGAYMLGSPDLLTYIEGKETNPELYKDGVNAIDGHMFWTVGTGMDGFFKFYDFEDSEHTGTILYVDTFATDIARLALVPVALIPDVEEAEEYGRYFEVDDGYDSGTIAITVHRSEDGRVLEVDIEWYKLVIWNDKRFGGAYGEEE